MVPNSSILSTKLNSRSNGADQSLAFKNIQPYATNYISTLDEVVVKKLMWLCQANFSGLSVRWKEFLALESVEILKQFNVDNIMKWFVENRV